MMFFEVRNKRKQYPVFVVKRYSLVGRPTICQRYRLQKESGEPQSRGCAQYRQSDMVPISSRCEGLVLVSERVFQHLFNETS